MRQGIDITDVESDTKIRAKFLRSLENEERSQVGDDTLVRSFLRTYAEHLGLDAPRIVEEYALRRQSTDHFANPSTLGRERIGAGAPRFPRWAAGVALLAVAALLLWIGGSG